MIKNYEEQVYAGVLGKVIGVYMGRPFEGWTKEQIERRWGVVDRYVHEDRQVPLVVSDDDISGTFTFVRALEDSGLYAETPPDFFGDTWLNYLIPHQTVLWWGGMGVSTEHTAYIRLKQGFRSPESGSMATNGRIVAEQIGAQIFIDAFGLVAPGRPELAADLARRAGAVSHDGEAVNAAIVVAGMIAAAFVEKDMDRLLDIGAGLIPKSSLIARIHRDVRAWAAGDRDWRRTYDRISRKYGYDRYGGGCHIVPNHAIMVMAWAYAPDDFHQAQVIINTAGWDTDCNAANVGALMGVKVGLGRINEKYDFQGPFGDRILIPTAEGSRGSSDVLAEALRISRIGRTIMGWKQLPAPKKGAWHHFEMPGAQQGYLAETDRFECRGAAGVKNVAGHSATGQRSLRISFEAGPGRVAKVSAPVYPLQEGSVPGYGAYSLTGTPQLYTGNTVNMHVSAGKINGPARARIFIRHFGDSYAGELPSQDRRQVTIYGSEIRLRAGVSAKLSFTVPETAGRPVQQLGVEILAEEPASGEIFVDRVERGGSFRLSPQDATLPFAGTAIPGWIRSMDRVSVPPPELASKPEGRIQMTRDEGRGVLVTGNMDWRDIRISARMAVHLADQAGIIVRYQGLERYIAVLKTTDRLRLVMRHYGDSILDESPCRWKVDELHHLAVEAVGEQITVWCDGRKVLEGRDKQYGCGGAGFLLETGTIRVRDIGIEQR